MGASWTPTLWHEPPDHAERDARTASVERLVAQVGRYPRIRYMGSKYRLVPHLAALFDELRGRTALDAFSGSGVVAYLLKALGYSVTTNESVRDASSRGDPVHPAAEAGEPAGGPEDVPDPVQQPPPAAQCPGVGRWPIDCSTRAW